MNDPTRLRAGLLALRITVFAVLVVWVVQKFVHPQHFAKLIEHFYSLGGLEAAAVYAIAAIEAIILLGFVVGVLKGFTYGAVLVFHAASTFASFPEYFDPLATPNILFFAAWPMLAACLVLFLLRHQDTFLSLS